jgi:hypothetical protein
MIRSGIHGVESRRSVAAAKIETATDILPKELISSNGD